MDPRRKTLADRGDARRRKTAAPLLIQSRAAAAERPGLKVSGGPGTARLLLSRVFSRWRGSKPRLEEEGPVGRRFLSGQARGGRTAELLEATRSYVRKKPAGEKL